MSNLLLNETAAPSTPAAAKVVVYVKADGLVYAKDDAGAETQLSNVGLGGITLGTPVASTSGTTIDFTGIPSGTKRIIINFLGVSTNGTSAYLIQIGDAGGIETSGYLSGGWNIGSSAFSSTTAFIVANPGNAAAVMHGSVILSLEASAAFSWCALGTLYRSDAAQLHVSAGSKSLSAELTQVRITSVTPDTFDAGSINISYE